MDVHVPRSISIGLRLRGVDVLTAQDDGAAEFSDAALLDRANELQRALVTFDDDLLIEASRRQSASIPFSGVIYAHQLGISIGTCINDLELIAKGAVSEELANRVEYLPL